MSMSLTPSILRVIAAHVEKLDQLEIEVREVKIGDHVVFLKKSRADPAGRLVVCGITNKDAKHPGEPVMRETESSRRGGDPLNIR